jgi:protein-tyrosine-phosphatase
VTARILVLCRANVARSPLLAARLQLEVDARDLDGAVEITSAGVAASFGLPVASGSQVVAERWGLDLGDHQARPLLHADADLQDLVLTMERAQTRRAVASVPALEGRAFTAPELAYILAAPDVGEWLPDAVAVDAAGVAERVRSVVELADGYRPGWWEQRRGALEVADPIQQGQEVYDQIGERFVELSAVIATGLLGPRGRGQGLPG